MIEPQGWIKLHRKILENPIFKNPDAFMLWVQLLLRANHKDGKFMLGNQVIDIKRGQIMTGRKSLSTYTGLSESKIERLLKCLEIEQQIEQQTFTKYRLISITNYNKYQGVEQQVDNNRTTTEQQPNTNKNDNNENNENKFNIKNIKSKGLDFSGFNNESIFQIWCDWLNFKYVQFKDEYKQLQSEQTALNKLKKLSKGSSEESKLIIDSPLFTSNKTPLINTLASQWFTFRIISIHASKLLKTRFSVYNQWLCIFLCVLTQPSILI